jgi:uncharacterized protein YqgC (DUF456 family)
VTLVTLTEGVVALAILVGLLGIIVPILPGGILIFLAVLAWAVLTGGLTAWLVFAVAAAFLVAGTVVKYAVPGKRLKDAGIPASTQWTGVALGVVGFFVIPVVGLFVGFVVGIYLAERSRLGPAGAGPSTKAALRAAGLSIVIELAAAILATVTWVVGLAVT